MGKILPILIALIGLGGGVGAGMVLRPPPEEVVIDPCGDGEAPKHHAEVEEETTTDFVKLNNQFVVPVVRDERVASLVVMSMSIEVSQGQSSAVYQREPKIRDMFLQVLFDHANAGGFEGNFTAGPNMEALRTGLTETAQMILGDMVSDVLITEIARQDL